MLSRLVKLSTVVAFVGPLVAAFVLAPVEALAAWRVWGLMFVPTLLVIITGAFFRAYRPLVDAPLAATAGEWTRQTLDRLGLIGIRVAAMDKALERGSFYHPSARTIVLAEDVHGEHTARAYATAAHELGHALFHTERPILSRVLLAARGHADRCFYYGVSLLFGTVIVGETSLQWLAFGLVAVAVVLHALVVVDETIASDLAGDFLRDDLGDVDQGRIARNHLRRALVTYVSRLVGFVVPLAAAAWVLQGDAGTVSPAAALDCTAGTFADIAAWVVVAGGVGAIAYIVVPDRSPFGAVAAALGISWTPLLFVFAADQQELARSAVALAAVPAWMILSMPIFVVVGWFGGKLGSDADSLPLPVPTGQGAGHRAIKRVSILDLRDATESPGVLARASLFSFALWAVPLALAWLGWL